MFRLKNTTGAGSRFHVQAPSTPVLLNAEISVRSPRKLFIFIVYEFISWIKVSKTYFILFLKRKHCWTCVHSGCVWATDWCVQQKFMFQHVNRPRVDQGWIGYFCLCSMLCILSQYGVDAYVMTCTLAAFERLGHSFLMRWIAFHKIWHYHSAQRCILCAPKGIKCSKIRHCTANWQLSDLLISSEVFFKIK